MLHQNDLYEKSAQQLNSWQISGTIWIQLANIWIQLANIWTQLANMRDYLDLVGVRLESVHLRKHGCITSPRWEKIETSNKCSIRVQNFKRNKKLLSNVSIYKALPDH